MSRCRGRDRPFGRPPRTDPYVRNYLIRLLPWVRDREALAASRTPPRPNDTEFRRCVRSVACWTTFPLVDPLTSTDSAATVAPGLVRLLLRYYETVRLPEDVHVGCSTLAFSDRSLPPHGTTVRADS